MSKKLPSTPRGRKRLLKLAKLLKENSKNEYGAKFDFGVWGYTEETTPRLDCGTTACALGIAAISGKFKDLSVKTDGRGNVRILYKGNKINEIKAAQRVFDLTEREAELLFLNMDLWYYSGAEGEREWVMKVRDFVKKGKVPL